MPDKPIADLIEEGYVATEWTEEWDMTNFKLRVFNNRKLPRAMVSKFKTDIATAIARCSKRQFNRNALEAWFYYHFTEERYFPAFLLKTRYDLGLKPPVLQSITPSTASVKKSQSKAYLPQSTEWWSLPRSAKIAARKGGATPPNYRVGGELQESNWDVLGDKGNFLPIFDLHWDERSCRAATPPDEQHTVHAGMWLTVDQRNSLGALYISKKLFVSSSSNGKKPKFMRPWCALGKRDAEAAEFLGYSQNGPKWNVIGLHGDMNDPAYESVPLHYVLFDNLSSTQQRAALRLDWSISTWNKWVKDLRRAKKDREAQTSRASASADKSLPSSSSSSSTLSSLDGSEEPAPSWVPDEASTSSSKSNDPIFDQFLKDGQKAWNLKMQGSKDKKRRQLQDAVKAANLSTKEKKRKATPDDSKDKAEGEGSKKSKRSKHRERPPPSPSSPSSSSSSSSSSEDSSIAAGKLEHSRMIEAWHEMAKSGIPPCVDVLKSKQVQVLLGGKRGPTKALRTYKELFKPLKMLTASLRVQNTPSFAPNIKFDELFDSEGKVWKITYWIIRPKNAVKKMNVVVNADSTTMVKPSTVTNKFHNQLQFCDAVDRRMQYMLRCGYPDCQGFIPPNERGGFMEYCHDLKIKCYEYELESLVDYDTEVMELRKSMVWTFDESMPAHMTTVNWRKKAVHRLRCLFCQRGKHTLHTCSFKASEDEIPAPRDDTDNICTFYNAGTSCPDGDNCKMEHRCILCKSSTHAHPVFKCNKLKGKFNSGQGNRNNNNRNRGNNHNNKRGGGRGGGRGKGKKKPAANP